LGAQKNPPKKKNRGPQGKKKNKLGGAPKRGNGDLGANKGFLKNFLKRPPNGSF